MAITLKESYLSVETVDKDESIITKVIETDINSDEEIDLELSQYSSSSVKRVEISGADLTGFRDQIVNSIEILKDEDQKYNIDDPQFQQNGIQALTTYKNFKLKITYRLNPFKHPVDENGDPKVEGGEGEREDKVSIKLRSYILVEKVKNISSGSPDGSVQQLVYHDKELLETTSLDLTVNQPPPEVQLSGFGALGAVALATTAAAGKAIEDAINKVIDEVLGTIKKLIPNIMDALDEIKIKIFAAVYKVMTAFGGELAATRLMVSQYEDKLEKLAKDKEKITIKMQKFLDPNTGEPVLDNKIKATKYDIHTTRIKDIDDEVIEINEILDGTEEVQGLRARLAELEAMDEDDEKLWDKIKDSKFAKDLVTNWNTFKNCSGRAIATVPKLIVRMVTIPTEPMTTVAAGATGPVVTSACIMGVKNKLAELGEMARSIVDDLSDALNAAVALWIPEQLLKPIVNVLNIVAPLVVL